MEFRSLSPLLFNGDLATRIKHLKRKQFAKDIYLLQKLEIYKTKNSQMT